MTDRTVQPAFEANIFYTINVRLQYITEMISYQFNSKNYDPSRCEMQCTPVDGYQTFRENQLSPY